VVLLVLAAAVGAYRWSSHGPSLPYHGWRAEAFLRGQTGGDDAISAARCAHGTCTVWFAPYAPLPSRRVAFMNFGVDIFMTSGFGQPYGAVGVSNWRFRYITNVGVLRAHCSTSEADRLAGTISPSRVRRVCHARIR
jgi:hypothetical protein